MVNLIAPHIYRIEPIFLIIDSNSLNNRVMTIVSTTNSKISFVNNESINPFNKELTLTIISTSYLSTKKHLLTKNKQKRLNG